MFITTPNTCFIKLITVFSLLAILLLSSCQKEPNVNIRINGPAGNDSTVLSKMIALDTTRPSGLDTLSIIFFHYDNEGRLSGFDVFEREDTSSSPVYIYHEVTKLYYAGNDTLPQKMTFTTGWNNSSFFDTVYYKYQQGFVSYDSAIKFSIDPFGTYREVKVQSYSVNGNNVTAHVKQWTTYDANPPNFCEDNYNYAMSYANGNIASENGSIAGPCGTGAWDQTYTYDNKVNPLYPIDIHYRVITGGHGLFDAQKNNRIQSMSTSGGSQMQNWFVYRSDGYPLIARSKDILDPSYQAKTLFYYTQ